jgi:hypothetical protein
MVFKTFTTERKALRKTSIDISRKGSVVKERCRQLSDIALMLREERKISNEDLSYLVCRYIGADKETMRAYLGYYGRIKRSKRTGEGYSVGLPRKGYLEVFGFMHRARNNEWVIHEQVTLPSAVSAFHTSECSDVFKEKISISSSVGVVSNRETVGNGETVERGKKEEEDTERDRNFTPKMCPKISELTPEEQLILTAKPTDKSIDRAFVRWGTDGGS